MPPRSNDALSTQPFYCYGPQQNEVGAFCRKLFIMSPLRVCNYAEQIRTDDYPNPVFFFVKDHKEPVPQEFWDALFKHKTTYVEVHLPLEDYITKA